MARPKVAESLCRHIALVRLPCVNAKEILFQILHRALEQIRAHRKEPDRVNLIATLTHNLPSVMSEAVTEEDYQGVLNELWERATSHDSLGRLWLQGELEAMGLEVRDVIGRSGTRMEYWTWGPDGPGSLPEVTEP